MTLRFDIMLPTALFLITAAAILLYGKYEKKVKRFMEGREFKTRDVILLVAAIGIMVSVVALLPGQALMILYLFAYSILLFQFSYMAYPKWYTSIIPPALFIVLYALLGNTAYWSPFILDFFAVIFSIILTVYLSSMFTWKTTVVFGAFITVVDILQTSYTRFMVGVFEKTIGLNLPVAILVPVVPLIALGNPPYPIFPYAFSGLGLGDLFFSGLLTIQTMKKYGRRLALVSALSIGVVFFIIEMVTMTSVESYYPATVSILAGWLVPILPKYVLDFVNSRRNGEQP